MEITLEAIISLVTLLTGGGCGTFFTWRWMKRKAKADAASAEAEAKQKEAEAEQARIEANKQFQEMYKTMFNDIKENYEEKQGIIDELRADRDHYKTEAEEYRGQISKLSKQFLDYKYDNEREKMEMKRDIARNGRMVECMRPLLCGRENCANRVPVTISAQGVLEKTFRPSKERGTMPAGDAAGTVSAKEIDPLDQSEL